jgi:hypothetical protein
MGLSFGNVRLPGGVRSPLGRLADRQESMAIEETWRLDSVQKARSNAGASHSLID